MDAPTPTRYQVLSEIGSGGMGRVFRARDLRLGREVALKRLLPSLASEAAATERFLREARAAAAFSHPFAVHVYDVDQDAEGPFIAFELVPGGSLADKLRGGPLPARDALRLVRQVGGALSAAHAAGILHRDVKPSNVLLDAQGHPRLTDFGLALFEGRGELTRSLVGTPEYMAPEQAGEPGQVDARADQYALAATLYACLTGEAPRLIRESRIPEGLRPVLLKALSTDPAGRYPTMDSFLRALETAGGARTVRARRLFALKVVGALGAAGSLLSLGYTLFQPGSGGRRPAARTSYSTFSTPERPAVPSPPPKVASGVVARQPEVDGRFEQMQIHKSVVDSGYALGFVVNHGEAPLERPKVELRFLDADGGLVQAATGYCPADRVEPGGRFPVQVLLKPHPVRYAKVESQVVTSPGYTRPSGALEVVEQKMEPDRFSGQQLFTKVKNVGAVAVSYPEVAAVVYDASGQLIGFGSGYLASKSLPPSQESTATVRITTYGTQPPARFEVYLYGAQER